MTADDAVRWAAGRACKDCRKSDNPSHAGCAKAQEVAEMIRRLADAKA